jgi:hypothetical protein
MLITLGVTMFYVQGPNKNQFKIHAEHAEVIEFDDSHNIENRTLRSERKDHRIVYINNDTAEVVGYFRGAPYQFPTLTLEDNKENLTIRIDSRQDKARGGTIEPFILRPYYAKIKGLSKYERVKIQNTVYETERKG